MYPCCGHFNDVIPVVSMKLKQYTSFVLKVKLLSFFFKSKQVNSHSTIPRWHNIHMYPYFLFAAIHHLKSSPTFSVRPHSSVGKSDANRRSWVRFPPRSKDFFFVSCGSLIPFTRANVQWVIHGSK